MASFASPRLASPSALDPGGIGSRRKSLAFFTGELYDGYRIEVRRTHQDETVLTTDELAWSGNHLGVVLATSELEDGDYDIQLFGVEDGEVTRLRSTMRRRWCGGKGCLGPGRCPGSGKVEEEGKKRRGVTER